MLYWKPLVAADRVINAMLGGDFDETLSSRAYRMRAKNQPVWGWTADLIDFVFFWQPDHCARSYRHGLARLAEAAAEEAAAGGNR